LVFSLTCLWGGWLWVGKSCNNFIKFVCMSTKMGWNVFFGFVFFVVGVFVCGSFVGVGFGFFLESSICFFLPM